MSFRGVASNRANARTRTCWLDDVPGTAARDALVRFATHDAIATEILRVPERLQRQLINALRSRIVRRNHGNDTGARGHVPRYRGPRMVNRKILHSSQHSFGQLRRLRQVQPRGQGRDLILVETAAQVAGATETTADDPGDTSQRLVGTRLAEGIFVSGEAVEIEHQETQPPRL